jgi:phosphoesterase RecJ-like protein
MFPRATIDHHRPDAALPQLSDSKPVSVIDSNAPSTTFIIYNFLKESGYKISSFESSLLFLGLCTDTGFFRHLTENSGDAFKTAGELCDLGASPNNAFHSIYGNRTIASRKFLGIMLSRAQTCYNGQLLIIYEKISDLDIYSPQDRDKDILYQILQGTIGVKIVASFTEEEKDRKCTVSLRTRDDIDLNKLAAHFGGGGHKKASGYTAYTGIDEAMSSFISYTETLLF